jgi:hypothetical protein
MGSNLQIKKDLLNSHGGTWIMEFGLWILDFELRNKYERKIT